MLEHIYSVLPAIGLREPHHKKTTCIISSISRSNCREADKKFSPDDVIHMLMDLSRVLERVEVIKKNTWNSVILIHDI